MMTWREMIREAMEDYSESWGAVEDVRPKNIDLDKPFNATSKKIEGEPFYLWTRRRVYFACTSDGLEWVASVPRNPTSAEPKHIGNEI